MTHKKRIPGQIGVLLSLLLLAACIPAAPTIPATQDLNPVRTEVAATVLAQVTQALALTPSATFFSSPTVTNQPTSTTTTGVTPSPSPNATDILSSGTPNPEAENKAQWVSQSIVDDTIFAPGETFTMRWRLKNTGTSTWTTDYMLRYFTGDLFGAPKEIFLDQEVLPGGEVDISIDMKAPARVGVYRSDWVMATAFRFNFKEPVFLKIIVAVTPTPTPAPTSTRTRTPSPTP